MLRRHDSSEVKYPDNRVLETPHRIASRMFSAFLDQRVVHVFQPAVKMSALEALFKPLRGHTLQGVSSSREKPFLQPEEKVLVACSILCTSAECCSVLLLPSAWGLLMSPTPNFRQSLCFWSAQPHCWQGSAQLIYQTSYVFFFQAAEQTQAASTVIRSLSHI